MKREQVANRPSWDHGHKTVAVPGTAEHLVPSLVIPDGFELVVRALPDNTDNIHLGKSKAKAESADRLTFSKGNGITLKVKNANQVWVDATVADEGVDYWVEQ